MSYIKKRPYLIHTVCPAFALLHLGHASLYRGYVVGIVEPCVAGGGGVLAHLDRDIVGLGYKKSLDIVFEAAALCGSHYRQFLQGVDGQVYVFAFDV